MFVSTKQIPRKLTSTIFAPATWRAVEQVTAAVDEALALGSIGPDRKYTTFRFRGELWARR